MITKEVEKEKRLEELALCVSPFHSGYPSSSVFFSTHLVINEDIE